MRDHAELPFSPAFDFVWLRPCTLNGVAVEAGDAVDKNQLDERRLRVLFQTRRIAPAGFGDGVKPAYIENGRGVAAKLAAQRLEEGEGDEADAVGPASAPRRTKPKRTLRALRPAKAKAAKPKPKAKPKRSPQRRPQGRVSR